MNSINAEYLTGSFFSLLLMNDPETVEKNKDTDEIHKKVFYLMQLEKMYNLERFEFNLLENDEKIETDDEFFKKMNSLFKTKLRQPKTYNGLINFYYLRCNNLIGKLGFINRKVLKKGFKYEYNAELYKYFIELYEKNLNNKIKETLKDIEDKQLNIFLSDDVNILKCLIDEVREDNKKYEADDEKETPKAVLNKKDDDTDDETDDEDPPPLDDPEIIDIFINGYKTQIQIY
jgi:hypothetical protein